MPPNMNNTELVSIIMPTYNTKEHLHLSIESILNQTYPNFELLITDDCSSDPHTIETIKHYASIDQRVKPVFFDHNQGAGCARNNAIGRATGRYIAFCDSDDCWLPCKLEVQIAFMKEKRCALSCASYIVCDSQYKEIGINIPPRIITYSMLKRDNKVGCLTAMYDVQLLGKKFYMPTLRKRQDWGLFLQIVRECGRCYVYTERPLAKYCTHENSVSSDKFSLVKYNIAVYRTVLGYGPIKSFFYFFGLFMPTYISKIIRRKIDSKRYVIQKKHRN